MQAHAALQNRGTGNFGNRLIYDSDLNITWYDYTKSADSWQNQVNWASALSVNFYSIDTPCTDQPDMLRWDYRTIIAGGGASKKGCFVCHSTKWFIR